MIMHMPSTSPLTCLAKHTSFSSSHLFCFRSLAVAILQSHLSPLWSPPSVNLLFFVHSFAKPKTTAARRTERRANPHHQSSTPAEGRNVIRVAIALIWSWDAHDGLYQG